MARPYLLPAPVGFAVLLLAACGNDPATTRIEPGEDAATAPTPDIGDLPLDDIQSVAPDVPQATEGDADPRCDTLGCPCATDDECASGYCVDGGPQAGRVCAELCRDGCSVEGYECVVLVNTGGDAVQLCVPLSEDFCLPCVTDRNCGRLGNVCLDTLDGRHCATPCAPDRPCPRGGVCTQVNVQGSARSLCLPETGSCSACLDRDGDGWGEGPGCLGPDCDDTDASIFPRADERCDGVDNNCDGAIDEGFDFQTDPLHCGACGVLCSLEGATARCQSGACAVDTCLPGFADCDGVAANGCERDAASLNACGGCDPLPGTIGDLCGSCAAGELACDGTDALACVDATGTPVDNACGGCDPLPQPPGTPCGTCGTGLWACDGPDAVRCADDPGESARNVCGGCTPITGTLGQPCGTCNLGRTGCAGTDAIACLNDPGEAARNACGGCATLTGTIGQPCGTCGSGQQACAGPDAFGCFGDRGNAALNACGGCTTLAAAPTTACGPCLDGAWTCQGGDAVTCQGFTPDSDNDTVCDDRDVCPGFDDRIDTDGDTIPDGCDRCPGFDDRIDTDGDTIPDGCDRCQGFDDRIDTNVNGTPDGCDCAVRTCAPEATCTASTTGTTCTCNAGFTGDGTTCTPVTCPTLPAPANGTVTLTGTAVGSTATTTCRTGWTLQGTSPRTCQLDGTWSGTAGTCFRPPGDLWCVCNQVYSAGTRVRLVNTHIWGALPPVGTLGTVIAGNSTQGEQFSLMVAFDGWTGGSGGLCDAINCGPCSSSGRNRTFVGCNVVEPIGP
jgi:hypothetical protein